MKFVEIIADRSDLYSAQIEFCVAELKKAVGHNGEVTVDTDEHRFYCLGVYIPEDGDFETVAQIACDMCAHGCTAIWGYERSKADKLQNFGYRLDRI